MQLRRISGGADIERYSYILLHQLQTMSRGKCTNGCELPRQAVLLLLLLLLYMRCRSWLLAW